MYVPGDHKTCLDLLHSSDVFALIALHNGVQRLGVNPDLCPILPIPACIGHSHIIGHLIWKKLTRPSAARDLWDGTAVGQCSGPIAAASAPRRRPLTWRAVYRTAGTRGEAAEGKVLTVAARAVTCRDT